LAIKLNKELRSLWLPESVTPTEPKTVFQIALDRNLRNANIILAVDFTQINNQEI